MSTLRCTIQEDASEFTLETVPAVAQPFPREDALDAARGIFNSVCAGLLAWGLILFTVFLLRTH